MLYTLLLRKSRYQRVGPTIVFGGIAVVIGILAGFLLRKIFPKMKEQTRTEIATVIGFAVLVILTVLDQFLHIL